MVDWVGLVLILTGLAVFFLLLNEINEQQKRKPRQRRHRPRPGLDQAGAEQAIAKVQGYTHDRETAIRLIHQYCGQHPKRSLDWIVEKVIYDLVRDRQ